MKYRDMWKLCEECIETYDMLPKTVCVTHDEHVNEIIADQMDIEPDEVVFVKEAVGGVFRHRKFVEAAMSAYCDGMFRNRQDYVTMYLIVYLLVYRFEEIGGLPFRQLIHKSTANNRIAEFLQFFLDRDMLEQHAIPRWRQCYDDTYVEDVLVGSLMKNKPAIEAHVLNWYLEKATSTSKAETMDSEETIQLKRKIEPASPKFTKKDKSHSVRQDMSNLPPMEVREMINTKPLPKMPRIADTCTQEERDCVAAAKRGQSLSTLAPETRAKNRRKENEIPFHAFTENERPSHKDRLVKEKADREAQEIAPLALNRPSPTQVRQQLQNIATTVDVRTTNAALRREDIIYRRRIQEEEEELRRKERDLRDDSEYWAWRNREEAREKAERESKIAQRKIDMMIADEEARAVRVKQEKANQQISRQFRQDNEKWKSRFEKEEAKRMETQRNRAAKLKEDLKIDTEGAIQQKKKEKQQIANDVKTEKHRNEMKVAMALELERERKQEVIKEIKAIHERSIKIREEERERKKNVRAVDIGQLVTMTYEELQSKLAEVKREQTELTEKRRQTIVSKKEAQQLEKQAMTERILQQRARYRNEKETSRTLKRDKAAEEAEKVRVQEERRIFELQQKLREKREARESEISQRKEEERQRRLAAQLLSADAGAIEREKWREMERGAQNTILKAQNSRLQENRVERAKQQGITSLRERNIEQTHQARTMQRTETDRLFETKRSVYVADKEYDDDVRKAAYAAMKVEKEMMKRHVRSA